MDIDQITKSIIGCAYNVSNCLGSGFLEKVYERAMIFELSEKGLKVQQQYPIEVYYRNQLVGEYFADLFVNATVVVELKAVGALSSMHQAQLINYLTASNKKIGLLLNFGQPRVEIKRIVNQL